MVFRQAITGSGSGDDDLNPQVSDDCSISDESVFINWWRETKVTSTDKQTFFERSLYGYFGTFKSNNPKVLEAGRNIMNNGAINGV